MLVLDFKLVNDRFDDAFFPRSSQPRISVPCKMTSPSKILHLWVLKFVYVIGLLAVQFGNNWMKKIPRTAEIGRVQFGCQRNFLNPIISKIGQACVVLLLINYIACQIKFGITQTSIILIFYYLFYPYLSWLCKFTISQNTVISATVLQMTVQRALHNSQAFWLVFVPVFFSNFCEETAKNFIQLIARDVFKLSFFRCTFHSLKTFSQVFVLLEVFWFARSYSCSVVNLSFAVLSLKRSWVMEKFGKSALLNSAIVQQQETQQHDGPVYRADAML